MTALIVIAILQSAPDCLSCGKKADPKKPAAPCAACKFDPRAAPRACLVGTLQKKENADEPTFEIAEGAAAATLICRESQAAAPRALAGKRVRVQGIRRKEAWLIAKIEEVAPATHDLVILGAVKNAGQAKRLRAGLCSDASSSPLYVGDVAGTDAVVRVTLPARGAAGKEKYWAVVWDDADGDGLPNEPGRSLSPSFHRLDGKWFDKEELVESPVTVLFEIP